MKIAILGAGFAGLSAAYELNKQGFEVWIFEKKKQAGGAAGGFKRPSWDWYLDYAYHHWFTNDYEILKLAEKIGFNNVLARRPETASLYEISNNQYTISNNKPQQKNSLFEQLFGTNTQTYKLDSPFDLLKFDRLSLPDRLRTGMVLAALKFGPKIPLYDTTTAYDFLNMTMGKQATKTLWEPLFSKKFGSFAPDIATAFFWARIKKRTPALAYPAGGFQEFANYFSLFLQKKGVKILYEQNVEKVTSEQKYVISTQKNTYEFNAILNTLPSPLFLNIQRRILSNQYYKRLSNIKYIGAHTLVLETIKPVLQHTYWLNITLPNSPWMVAVQHTNFMDKKYFGNHHLLYLATYTEKPLNSSILNIKHPDILWSTNAFIPLAQPLYTTDFTKYVPHTAIPDTKGLSFANMELTYPYDRGTNYAVKVGVEAARALIRQ